MGMDGGGAQTFFLDGVPFRALHEPDLDWLRGYGRVLAAWDRQLPGLLCFGVEGPYGRLLIKYAGAWTEDGRVKPADAVYALEGAMRLYRMEHPCLLKPLAHGPAGGGYAAVFPWPDAPLLRAAPADPAVRSRMRHLALERSLKMLDGIFDLHVLLSEEEGLVASDFHDGHLLIDFDRDRLLLWHLDGYLRKPAVNRKGRLAGSSRFMAPEEYALDAALDETTTVYNLGALAFEFYGDNGDRSADGWIGPEGLYQVARRATMEKNARRYPSVRAFQAAWRQAVGGVRL